MIFDTSEYVESLTPREEEVLDLLAQEGLSNKELAARLVVVEGTIWTHLKNIYRKLNLESRGAAIVWAHQHRIQQQIDT
jgi:DNA-binding NarL/FixJ family response regulator